jgi:hypothetical protein
MDDLKEALALALKVLADWRVIFIAVAIVLAWVALRYVGIVYHRRPRARPRPVAPSAASAPKAGGTASGRGGPSEGESGDEGMVE